MGQLITQNSKLLLELNASKVNSSRVAMSHEQELASEISELKKLKAENEAIRVELQREKRKREKLVEFYAKRGISK